MSLLSGSAFGFEALWPSDDSKFRTTTVSDALNIQIDRPPAVSRATIPTRPPIPPVPATPSPVVTPTVTPTPVATKLSVPKSGPGTFTIAAGSTEKPDRSRLVRYRVEVEKGLPFNPAEIAADAHAALTDNRSWGHDGKTGFQRVDGKSYDVRVLIASAATTDRLCLPLKTQGWKSCRMGNKVVLNADRWAFGVEDYAGHVDLYRIYLVNHEMGHFLGHGHVSCPKPGALAPVMMQQTKGLKGCKMNPWPYPSG